MRICLATNNQGKVKEYRALLDIAGLCLLTPSMLGVKQEADENGITFEQNALIKAREICAKTGLPTLADDSGLCIKALGDSPGIYSARYGGTTCLSDENRCQLILKEMQGIGSREAYFACAIAIVLPDGREQTFMGQLDGLVAEKMFGNNGFGYDPIFFLPHLGKHLAELSMTEKDCISHRAKAATKAKQYILDLMNDGTFT